MINELESILKGATWYEPEHYKEAERIVKEVTARYKKMEAALEAARDALA